MSEYLKPQSPIKYKKDDAYIYPLTTADQVLLDDNTRLNVALDDINSKIDNIDFSNIEGLDDVVQINLDGAVEGEASLANAGTLNGKTEDMLSVLRAVEAENAANANTLEGHSVNSLLNKIYPIGSIYMSVNSVSPDVLFGGTWEALQDRFLLGAGSTYSAGSTGGEATHTLTIDEMPSHNHKYYFPGYDTGTDWYGQSGAAKGAQSTTTAVGGSKPHNNMPPYLAVYMWKRTA